MCSDQSSNQPLDKSNLLQPFIQQWESFDTPMTLIAISAAQHHVELVDFVQRDSSNNLSNNSSNNAPWEWLQTSLDPDITPSLLHRLRRANLMVKGAQNIHPRATNIGFAHGLKQFSDRD